MIFCSSFTGYIVSKIYFIPKFRTVVTMSLNSIELAKQLAAFRAVDQYVESGHVVGVGSGSTICYAVDRLKERMKNEKLEILCIPTSFQARQLIINAGLPLSDLERTPKLDVAIDGADEVDAQLNCIKGGGGCMTQEKIVASCAQRFVIVADYRKDSEHLCDQWHKGIPVEVIPLSYRPVQLKLEEMSAKCTLRMAAKKAGPVITDNSCFILDCHFSPSTDWESLDKKIKAIPGVIETGLFINMAEKAYFGQEDGSVKEKFKKQHNKESYQ